MTDSLDILIPVFNEDQEINKTLALFLNNVKLADVMCSLKNELHFIHLLTYYIILWLTSI